MSTGLLGSEFSFSHPESDIGGNEQNNVRKVTRVNPTTMAILNNSVSKVLDTTGEELRALFETFLSE